MLTLAGQECTSLKAANRFKVSQEIQSVWDLINWKAAHRYGCATMNSSSALRSEFDQTPNPVHARIPCERESDKPNVILMCSYRELNTGANKALISIAFASKNINTAFRSRRRVLHRRQRLYRRPNSRRSMCQCAN